MTAMKAKFLVASLVVAILLSAGAAVTDYFVGDVFLAKAIQNLRLAPMDEAMEFASFIGRGVPMVIMAVTFLLWSMYRRHKAEYLVAGAALLSLGINPILKILIERPRPTEDLIAVWRENAGLGFPSGHAFTAVVLFGLAFYLAPYIVTGKWSVAMVRSLSTVMILLIGLSRVYVGAHWPSDVLGGFLFGAITLTFLVHFHGHQRPQADLTQSDQLASGLDCSRA